MQNISASENKVSQCFVLIYNYVSLLDSSKVFKRDPRENLMALMQGSAGGKSFYVTPIFT